MEPPNAQSGKQFDTVPSNSNLSALPLTGGHFPGRRRDEAETEVMDESRYRDD